MMSAIIEAVLQAPLITFLFALEQHLDLRQWFRDLILFRRKTRWKEDSGIRRTLSNTAKYINCIISCTIANNFKYFFVIPRCAVCTTQCEQ